MAEHREPAQALATVEMPVGTAVTVAEQGSAALMRLIERAATDASFDVGKLEKLLEVKERWEATEARKAFVAAKAAFKAEAPVIDKNKRVGFESKRASAADTEYYHATLDHIEELISPVLSKHGLSYSWETQQGEGGRITVTCVLTHVLGHSERVSLHASPDQSGNKNNIQAIGSTVTYLSRYTLLAITGLSTGDDDDDGQGSIGFLTYDEKEELIGLIKETNSDTAKFLSALNLGPSIDEIPSNRFTEAKNALLAKKKAQAAKQGATQP